MFIAKIAFVALCALTVGAEKKIELQDIENDNLKSERDKDVEKPEPRAQSSGPGSGPGLLPTDYLKNGLLRYFDAPSAPQQRFVQQYAVTEPPERPLVAVTPKSSQYGAPAAQQAMVGYLSNVPMQIYLVPQYYNDHTDHSIPPHVGFPSPGLPRVAPPYTTAQEAAPAQSNYVELPTYVSPTSKPYVAQYATPVAYVTYATQPTVSPTQTSVAPVLAYHMPVVQYQTTLVTPPVLTKSYYPSAPQYTETNSVDEPNEDDIESGKQYATQSEAPYLKQHADYPRYYSGDHRHGPVTDLPSPNHLLKGSPQHVPHIPKALPIYRPFSKPVYSGGVNGVHSGYPARPHEVYAPGVKRRPASLLESYIPSGLQVEYLKRGYVKEPLAAYDALASARHFPHPPLVPLTPRHFERGFLPNQMYPTAAGGVTYGHYKRTPKADKVLQNQ